jgi:hypothetical protein
LFCGESDATWFVVPCDWWAVWTTHRTRTT